MSNDTLAVLIMVTVYLCFPTLWYLLLRKARVSRSVRIALATILGTGTFYAGVWAVFQFYIHE